MGIKTFETRTNLLIKLKNRGLEFDEEDLKKVLIKYNYFELFNGIETLLLDNKNPKKYTEVNLIDFVNIYKFDKKFSAEVLSILNHVEERLKASVAYHFAETYCSNLNDTMQYTNKDNYMDPADNNASSKTYCVCSANYPFYTEQNYFIYHKFSKFVLFQNDFLNKLTDQNEHIDTTFYQDNSYHPPANVQKHNILNVAVPLWVAIETLDFGKLIRFLHYLKIPVLNKVMKDFSITNSHRVEFLNMLDFLLNLRNHCAHNSLIQRYRSPVKFKICNQLLTTFNLKPKNINSCLKLYDVLKILSFFEDISILQTHLDNILKLNISSMGEIKGKMTNNLLLKRMGCDNYPDWKDMLDGMSYIL